MFPTEHELEYRRQEMHRAAENQRLVNLVRAQPTLWQRFRARLSAVEAHAPARQDREQVTPRDVIALSR